MKTLLIGILALGSISSYSSEIDCSLSLKLDAHTYGYVQEEVQELLTEKGFKVVPNGKYQLAAGSSTLNSPHHNQSWHGFSESIKELESNKVVFKNSKTLKWNASLFDINWDKQAIRRIKKIPNCEKL